MPECVCGVWGTAVLLHGGLWGAHYLPTDAVLTAFQGGVPHGV